MSPADVIPLARRWRAARTSPASWKQRAAALAVAAVGAGVLTLAASLPPAPQGLGTHQQLGLAPCGFIDRTGIPCPTCGMTTAFASFMHGRPLAALRSQPAGAILAASTVAAVLLAAWTAASGRIVKLPWEWLATPAGLAWLGAVFFGGWTWKIADHLLHAPRVS